MVVLFTKNFLKGLKKHFNKEEAKSLVKKLENTSSTDGKFIALVKNIVIKELKKGSFRFYFVQDKNNFQIMTEEDLKNAILKFVALSKKNNQQKVIDKLKEDLKKSGFNM